MNTSVESKRVLTEEHKLKMKEGRERAAAEKLELEKKILFKLQKKLEKSENKLVKKQADKLDINEDPINESPSDTAEIKSQVDAEIEENIKDPKKSEETEKLEANEEAKKPEVKETAKKPKDDSEKSEVKEKAKKPKDDSEKPEVKEKAKKPKDDSEKPEVKEKAKKTKDDSEKPEVKEKAEKPKVSEKSDSKAVQPLVDNDDSDIEDQAIQFITKKKAIPKHVKTLVWNKYIGGDKAKAACMSCRQEEIGIRSFHCGHVIAESKGGDMTINNLRPICAACNGSMGTMSMNEFTSQFFGWSI